MLPPREDAEPLTRLGLIAFTTTRDAGSFGTATDEPVRAVIGRWAAMRQALGDEVPRLATAAQVHGARVVQHGAGWSGWLRIDAADGHATTVEGTAMAVTIADCVPVFLAHPAGAVALLHAGWRGTAAGILEAGVRAMAALGAAADDLVMHCGPAICGDCYEVSPDVYESLTGRRVARPATIDLREVLAGQARQLGVRRVSASASCTRCERSGPRRFYSHRAGEGGRQIAVLALRQAAPGEDRRVPGGPLDSP